jgi:hypothetical protein
MLNYERKEKAMTPEEEPLTINFTLTQDKFDRYLEEVDPLLHRLTSVTEDAWRLRHQNGSPDDIVDMFTYRLLIELQEVTDALIDAKARLTGTDLLALGKALQGETGDAEPVDPPLTRC